MANRQLRVLDAGAAPPAPGKRLYERVPIAADVMLRRSGQLNYRVSAHDISPHGCKLEFIDRPRLDEIVWVKFDGFRPIQSSICWTGNFAAGVEFQQPLHPAVFDLLLKRLGAASR